MIVDLLKNLEVYKSLSPNIYAGLKFLYEADESIALGEYPINKNTKAIVTEYETVAEFIRGYEAHKHVIDIQYPVRGLERVKWSPISRMDINIHYDEIKDRAFYKNPDKQGTHVDIGNGIFAIMFPEDGHSPQHFVGSPEMIKKITIKISI